MNNYDAAWADAQARQLAAHVARTSGVLATIADRLPVLRQAVSERGQGDGPFRPVFGPSVPLRVDVLDVLGEVDAFAARFTSLVRGTVRMGLGTGPKTASAPGHRVRTSLLLIADNLAGVYAEDVTLGDDVSAEAWRLDYRTGNVLGLRSRPFEVADPCSVCGSGSLWVHPERLLLRCANPECGAQSPVDIVRHAHTSSSDTPVRNG